MSSSGPITDPLRCAPTITLWMALVFATYRLSKAFKRAFFGLIRRDGNVAWAGERTLEGLWNM